MRFQRSKSSCGPHAIANCLEALGRRVDVRTVTKLAGTSEDGTSEKGVIGALVSLGYRPRIVDQEDFLRAWNELWGHLHVGPAILAAENGQHWISAIGILGHRIVVFDSWRGSWNKRTGGTYVLDSFELESYWGRSPERYYCILVSQ